MQSGPCVSLPAIRRQKGIALKPPRSVRDVIRDKAVEFDAAAGEAVVMIPLTLDQGRPVKANISMDAELLEAIDNEAERRGLTRSSFLASAAISQIAENAESVTLCKWLW
jgi:HicB_like antitoxin of bacterial toxin-antitoxin system